MKYIKKHWFILLFVLLTIIRFILSYKLPVFYLGNLAYDDVLMIYQSEDLLNGLFLGQYSPTILVKGIVFPILISLIQMFKLSYSITFTLLFISACIYFINAFRKLTNNKKYLLIIYAALLFNPVSFSSDLFQRLYRNTLSVTELLFFFGAIINILKAKKYKVLHHIFLGFITSLMYLTREDNIWTYLVFFVVYGYFITKNISNIKKKNIQFRMILLRIVPFFVIFLNLHIVSLINYNHYYVYTYNELNDSSFKEAYIKVLQIKDDKKEKKVAIPKSTFFKLADNVEMLNMTREDVDAFYQKHQDPNGEINNGNILWYFRGLMNERQVFHNGRQANEFYKRLSIELDRLFEEKVFEKEFVMPSPLVYMFNSEELMEIPKSIIDTIVYTTTYKNIKTLSNTDMKSNTTYKYDDLHSVNMLLYGDYRNTENLPTSNPIIYEILRLVYKYFTIIFSIISLLIYIKNITKKDEFNIVLHSILLSYLAIIGGVAYTNVTAFPSIRYFYLGNTYILQNLFILINLIRYIDKNGLNFFKRKEKNKKMKLNQKTL